MTRPAVRTLTLATFLACALAPLSADQASLRPRPAPATPGPGSVFVNAGGGLQLASGGFDETHTEQIAVEDSTWDARYARKNGPLVDVGGGVRLWKGLFAAVSYSWHDQSEPVTVSAKVPHPFFFNQPRTVEGTSSPLANREQAIHVSGTYVVPAGKRFEISVSAGPSFFIAEREFVTEVQYTEEYPFDTATFTGIASKTAKKKAMGANVGFDVTWLLTRQVGLGVLVRASQGSLNFTTPAGGAVKVDAGGVQTVAGLRFRFGGARTRAAGRPAPRPGPPPSESPESAQVPAAGSAIVLTAAPVYLRPDPTRVPLRTLAPGTTVRVLEESGEWVRIEFSDRQFGGRVGWVLGKYLRTK
jgi:hypothetical protein